MTMTGPLTEFFKGEKLSVGTWAKVSRILKINPRDLAGVKFSYNSLVTSFGNEFTPVHFVVIDDKVVLDALTGLFEEGWNVDLECAPLGTPLCVALNTGSILVARKLIEFGARTNFFTNNKHTPMHYALSTSKKPKKIISAVKVLCEAGVSLDAPCDRIFECRPLHVAVVNDCPKVVSFLIQLGADLNIKNRDNITPMHTAVSCNRVEIIALLMKHGVELDVKDRNNETPLLIATKQGTVETIAAFVENGFDINRYSFDLTLLHMAVSFSKFKLVEYLIESGADPNAKTALEHLHSLHLIATQRREGIQVNAAESLKVLDYLVEKGANVNCTEHVQDSPLAVSMLEGFLKFAKAIIAHGAKINGRLQCGNSLFHLAVMTNRNIIVTYLEFGGDYTMRNPLGHTPYHLAIRENVELNFIKRFIHTGCPYNQMTNIWSDVVKKVNNQETTKFFDAQRLFFKGVSENNLKLVKTSVKMGAISTGCSEEMKHPLHFVVSKGYESLVGYLLENHCFPNSLNTEGETPLQIAARKGNLNICSMLLMHGACYNCTSEKCSETPAKLAEEFKHTTVKYLFQEVAKMFHLAKKQPKVLVQKLCVTPRDDYLMFVNAINSSGHTLMSTVLKNEKNSNHANAMLTLRLKCKL